MEIKRGLGIILSLCVAMWLVTVVVSRLFGVNLENTDPASLPQAVWYISIISAGLLSAIGAMWYFKSPKIVSNAKNGFLLGLAMNIFGLVSDFLLFVPHQGGLDIFKKYFAQPMFWLAFVSILIACTLVGYVGAKKVRVDS
jgi:hypothetical protein